MNNIFVVIQLEKMLLGYGYTKKEKLGQYNIFEHDFLQTITLRDSGCYQKESVKSNVMKKMGIENYDIFCKKYENCK